MDFANDAPLAEQFHLAFLQVLGTAFRPARYVLKGGANLRYFFGSLRYSQDIDLDLIGGEGWRLEEAVDTVLGGRALTLLLRGPGLVTAEISKPKQTATTRRWKVGLRPTGRSDLVRTRIEFSSRTGEGEGDPRFELARVPDAVAEPYGVVSPVVQRYAGPSMVEQKIAALALRSETKARDVFDLDLLFRERTRSFPSAPLAPTRVAMARARAEALTDADFEAQVLPFLDPAVAPIYTASGAWSHLRQFVSDQLGRLDAPPASDGPAVTSPRRASGVRRGGRP